MLGTKFIPELAGRKFKDSMSDYPAAATHNLVFVSNTKPRKVEGGMGYWDGKNVPFIGEVFSEWVDSRKIDLNQRLIDIAKEHNINVVDIEIANFR
jgi:hypothetical protein